MSFSELLEERRIRKEVKNTSHILNTRTYRDAFGNVLTASQKQMEFLLRNFDPDVIVRLLKRKPAYIIVDDYYVEVFFAHSLTTKDMCIVFNNFQYGGSSFEFSFPEL